MIKYKTNLLAWNKDVYENKCGKVMTSETCKKINEVRELLVDKMATIDVFTGDSVAKWKQIQDEFDTAWSKLTKFAATKK